MVSKRIEKALNEAKRLEKERMPSDEEILDEYERGMHAAAEAAHLLKPAWFVQKPQTARKRAKRSSR